jgi:hypothetical protein
VERRIVVAVAAVIVVVVLLVPFVRIARGGRGACGGWWREGLVDVVGLFASSLWPMLQRKMLSVAYITVRKAPPLDYGS